MPWFRYWFKLNDNSGYDIHQLFDDDQICTNSGKKDDSRKTKLVVPRRQDKIKCLTTSKAQLYLFSTHSYHLAETILDPKSSVIKLMR
jgi:hypothetical protein